MRIVVLVSLVCCGLLVGAAHAEEEKGVSAKDKPNPDRISGMKAALADIEAGKLKQKFPPFPDSVQQRTYTELLKKECGVSLGARLRWRAEFNYTCRRTESKFLRRQETGHHNRVCVQHATAGPKYTAPFIEQATTIR